MLFEDKKKGPAPLGNCTKTPSFGEMIHSTFFSSKQPLGNCTPLPSSSEIKDKIKEVITKKVEDKIIDMAITGNPFGRF